MTPADLLKQAETTVQSLEDKRRALIQTATELAEERQRVSFAAHTGDAKARARLTEINNATANHASEVQSIEDAIREATARVHIAKTAEALAADRAAASKLAAELERFVELGELLDEALADVVSASSEMDEVLARINSLGCPSPNASQMRVLGTLALKTAVMNIGWTAREWEFLAPSSRKTFQEIVSNWRVQIERNISARIGEQKKDAA
jgi:hypothetical protein